MIRRCYFLSHILFFLFFMPLYAKETFLIPAKSEEAARLVEEADAFLQKKEWRRAIECYENILQKHRQSVLEEKNNRYINAALWTLQKVEKLPLECQRIWAEKIEIALKNEKNYVPWNLDTWIPFLASTEGKNRLTQMIDSALAREEYEVALSYLQYAMDLIWHTSLMEEQRARLIFCYYALGFEEQLDFFQNFYQSKKTPTLLSLAQKETPFLVYLHALQKKVKSHLAVVEKNSSWPMYGKNLARSFVIDQKIGSLKEGWNLEIPLVLREEGERFFYNERPRSLVGPQNIFPVIHDGMIFVNNGQAVYAYDLFTAHLKWNFPGLIAVLKTDRHEQVIHTITYDRGFLYANVEGPTPSQTKDSWSSYQIRKIIPERKLIKLDAATGRLIWQVKDEKGDEESFANKVSFTSAPLVWGDTLYVGATELSGLFNSYLVAVHSQDGRILWKTLIGSAQQELNMFGNPVRETVGTPLAGGDGRIYCLNNLGAFCAVHPTTGHILWLFLYDRIPLRQPQQALFETVYRQTGWYNSPVVLAGDKIYFAPMDCEYLYCLNAASGEKIWHQHRSGYHHFLGVAKDKVILGGRSIVFLDAKNGEQFSVIPLFADDIAGMGFTSGDLFYVPGTRHLHTIEISTEKLISSQRWPDALKNAGSLLMVDSVLLTSSSQYLNAFYDWEEVSQRFEKQRKQNPDDPLPPLKLAGLYIQRADENEKNLLKAEENYLAVLALVASDKAPVAMYRTKAESGLLSIYNILAQKNRALGNIAKAYEYATKALPFAQDAASAVPLLLRLYTYCYQNKEYDKAEKCLTEMMEKYGEETYTFPDEGRSLVALHALFLLARQKTMLEEGEKAVAVYQKIIQGYAGKGYQNSLAEKVAKKHIQSLILTWGRKVYEKEDQEALALYQKLREKPTTVDSFQRILALYPNTRYASEISLAIAQRLIQEGLIRNAIETLEALIREYDESPQAPYAYYLLVQCHEKNKAWATSKNVLKKIQQKYSGQTISWNGKKVALGSFVQEKLREKNYEGVEEKTLPKLKIWEGDTVKYTFQEATYPTLRLLTPQNSGSEEYKNLLFFNQGLSLFCKEAQTGRNLWNLPKIGWLYDLGFVGNFLIAWTGTQIFSIHPQTGQILWSDFIPQRLVLVQLNPSAIAILCHEKEKNLSTVYVRKPDSKEVLWNVRCPGSLPGGILLGQESLIVYSKNPSLLYVSHLADGSLIKQFPAIEGVKNHWDYYPFLPSPNLLCVVTENRWIECYEIPSFALLWKYDATSLFLPSASGLQIPMKPLLSGNESYLTVVLANQDIVCLDVRSGDVKWRKSLKGASVSQMVADQELFYFVEKRGTEKHFWALSQQDGSTKWVTVLMDELSSVDILLTDQYVVALINRYATGYHSQLIVFSKATGERIKDYRVKGGDRGVTYSEMILANDNLWIVKDNTIWVLGE